MKRFIAIILAVFLIAAFCAPMVFATDTASATMDDGNGGLIERAVVVYDLQELQDNPEILENRTPDTIIVERCIGVVTSTNGDGTLIYSDMEFNYIYYSTVRFSPWDVVVTYNVYNPETQYTDDVIFRFDFKIGNMMDLYG